MAEKILVASGKGGVGKSTVCLGLAAGLSSLGKTVLILEADTGFRGLDISLSVEDRALYDLGDLLEGRSRLEDTLLRHSRYGIELLCAPNDPEYLPDEDKLVHLLESIESRYTHILVDCGAGFGSLQARLARHCTQALVVTVPDPVPVRAATKVSALLHKNGLHNQRLVINRVPPRLPANGTLRDLDDVINLVGARLLGAIPEGKLVGVPQRTDGPAAEELFRMAERLSGKDTPLVLYP